MRRAAAKSTTPVRTARLYKLPKRRRAGANDLEDLFEIPRYDRNEVTLSEINRLRDMIDKYGMPYAVKEVGVSDSTLLRVCAGFGHLLTTPTRQIVREYLRGSRA